MSDLEDQRRYYELLMDEVGSEYQSRIDDLEYENARLRSCLSDDAENARLIMGENEQLRKLMRWAWDCINTGVTCDDCRLTFGDCALQSAMREMGVI